MSGDARVTAYVNAWNLLASVKRSLDGEPPATDTEFREATMWLAEGYTELATVDPYVGVAAAAVLAEEDRQLAQLRAMLSSGPAVDR